MRFLFTTSMLIAAFTMTSVASAAVLFQEDFTSADSSNIVAFSTQQTATTYVDYSSFTYGGIDFTLPANPYGDGTSKGMLVQVNRDEDKAASYTMYAANAQGAAMQFSGNYIVSYDVYMKYKLGQDDTTEFVGTALGKDGTGAYGRSIANSTASSVYTYFCNDGDNGDSDYRLASYDASNNNIFLTKMACEHEKAKEAFDASTGIAGNMWINFKIVVNDGTTTVFANDIELFNETTTYTDGAVGLFYEDFYKDSTAAGWTDEQWAIFDNFKVSEVPEPASLALFGLSGLALLRRRK